MSDGIIRYTMDTFYGNLAGQINSQWGEDVAVTMDDKLSLSTSATQTITGNVIFSGDGSGDFSGVFSGDVYTDNIRGETVTHQTLSFTGNTLVVSPYTSATQKPFKIEGGSSTLYPQLTPDDNKQGQIGTLTKLWQSMFCATLYSKLIMNHDDLNQFIKLDDTLNLIKVSPNTASDDVGSLLIYGAAGTGYPELLPFTDEYGSIGTSGRLWNKIYCNEINTSLIKNPADPDQLISMDTTTNSITISPYTNAIQESFTLLGGADLSMPQLLPETHECGSIGTSGKAWNVMYAKFAFDDDGSLSSYDQHNDLELLKTMKPWKVDGKIQRDDDNNPIVDKNTIPDFLKGKVHDKEGNLIKRKYIRSSNLAMLGIGAIRQLDDREDERYFDLIKAMGELNERIKVLESRQ